MSSCATKAATGVQRAVHQCPSRRATPKNRKSVVVKYKTGSSDQLQRLHDVSRRLGEGGWDDASLFADNFISFADGVRFVNDLDKEAHVREMRRALRESHDYSVAGCVAGVSDDESAGFMLVLGSSAGLPVPIVARFTVNEDGQIDGLWSRRGVLESEMRLLRSPNTVRDRMDNMPDFQVKELGPPDPQRQEAMLATLDRYLHTFALPSDAERMAAIEQFTSRSFQKWDGTGVWMPLLGEVGVFDRAGLSASMGAMMGLGGPVGAGRTRLVVRGRGVSATHNVAFLHLSFLAVNPDNGPMAIDLLAAFAMSSGGDKIKQVMYFRNAVGMQEYALAFNLDADISHVTSAPRERR